MPKPEARTDPFEVSLARLHEIVEQLEDGRLSLGESLAAYEEGIKHLKVCHEALAVTERKIEVLAGFDAAGKEITKPFDDSATGDDEANVARRSRPAKTPAASPRTDEEERGLF